MQKLLFYKALVILALSLLILIPLGLIQGKISERSSYRMSVEQDIANSWAGKQTLTGPLIIIPYDETVKKRVWDKNFEKYIYQDQVLHKYVYLLPETLSIDTVVDIEERYRGIYKVPVYTSQLNISGEFLIPKYFGESIKNRQIEWGKAYLTLGVSDIRGIRSELKLNWNKQFYTFKPGSKSTVNALTPSGVHASLGKLDPSKTSQHSFSINFLLAGTRALKFSPVGKTTHIEITAPWGHPSFIGKFLPEKYKISDNNFTANWNTTFFSTDIEALLSECINTDCHRFNNTNFGVAFIQPVDIYLQSERSVKYGILFVLLTFTAFLLYEILKKLSIHPVQYLLVGLSLSIFYLLLLSLSEHMIFMYAYCFSASACVILIGFYIRYIFQSTAQSLFFSLAIALIYGILYLIIQSEDHSLLMGSILSFSALALIMILTRNVNWYEPIKHSTE